MRFVTPFSFCLLMWVSSLALAQNTHQNTSKPLSGAGEQLSNQEQRAERIHLEDSGNRVDELRVGGQTKAITVQPKGGNLPAYEVLPSDGVRNRSRNGAETTTGSRVWNLVKF